MLLNMVKRSSKMTFRQRLMKLAYPFIAGLSKLAGRANSVENENKIVPNQSIYQLSVTLNNGEILHLEKLKGKKILIVNTASNCGYTGQYAGLQTLYDRFSEDLVVIGFPANDFKEQEKANDADIAEFCLVNYGVSFPLAQKSRVIKGLGQHPVFEWLTHKQQNGWNGHPPSWNFSKYLVNEGGMLTHYFSTTVSPLDAEVIAAIKE